MRFALLAALASVALAAPSRRWPAPSPPLKLNKWDQSMMDVAMTIGDWSWEPSTGWIEADDDGGHTSSRFTSWYVPGLLYRNKGDDVKNAIWAIKNVISLQFTDPKLNGTPWYGDYKLASDIPPPNPDTFPAAIYDSYDPNWSFFIGVQFVQIIEEFEHLLPSDLIDQMTSSMYLAARHLMARVGQDGDNLVTAYTNPALGRALLVSWVGDRLGDKNLTSAGDKYAQNIYSLFTADGHDTFGEYNVPTYYGEDVALLCQWIRHAPSSSKLQGYGKYMLQKLWDDIAQHYNYDLKNMVGPYDRVYHRNFLVDDSIVTLFFWLLLGRDKAPVAPLGQGSTIYDLRQGAAFALVGQTLRDNLAADTVQKLVTPVDQDRLFTKGIRVSLDNSTTRINTAWVSKNLMAGGQQVVETTNRGSQFTPMIAHWKSGNTALASRPYVSFFQLYDTSATVNATVTPYHISISYPNKTISGSDRFEYLIGDIPAPFWASGQNMHGFDNLPCLKIGITSKGLNGTVQYGKYGDFSIQSNNLWQVTYYVDLDYAGTPSMDFDLQYTC